MENLTVKRGRNQPWLRTTTSSGDQGNEDLKAKMREALERKQSNDRGVPKDGPVKEKAHGSEVDRSGRSEDAPPQGRRRGFLSRDGF